MGNNVISLKPVKELLGMNFFIPDYQRGYRWEKQQAIDLLEDIYAFALKTSHTSEEIYCVQPLVVSEKADDILEKCKRPESTLEDIKKYIKGSWTVVDGQQRLTTIYLLLSCLGIDDRYEIDYCTRIGSKDFLANIKSKNSADAESNVDYYHMYLVYSTINEWIDSKEVQDPSVRKEILDALLNQVNFIWYQVDEADEISVFTRLNIGKIPLTDSELIKALFLNRANFRIESDADEKQLEAKQRKIAIEWDQIEYALQNDEFWAFLHDFNYNKPTRIDFILNSICEKDRYHLRETKNRKKTKNYDYKGEIEAKERNGNDEHRTFRYFNEAFIYAKKNAATHATENVNTDWLDDLWKEVKKYYQVFNEWYQDYRLYHYIGYLTSIQNSDFDITDYVLSWEGQTKAEYIEWLKTAIAQKLRRKEWFEQIFEYKFDQEYNGKVVGKRAVVDILLLHNIETIIQQNDKFVSETKYNLPNFTKFPFHLYKREKWQVEHIRPNAGDDFKKDGADVLYLSLARQYFTDDPILTQKIDDYIGDAAGKDDFTDILTEITQKGGPLPDEDKNRIWNYVLLDESTNKEYGNQIFPVKRAFIANKEKGVKIIYSFCNGQLVIDSKAPEVAFVPPCTKNVFSKFYTEMPSTMMNWNIDDAEAYWNDIKEKLQYYFNQIGIV